MCYTSTKKTISIGKLYVNWITFTGEEHRPT